MLNDYLSNIAATIKVVLRDADVYKPPTASDGQARLQERYPGPTPNLAFSLADQLQAFKPAMGQPVGTSKGFVSAQLRNSIPGMPAIALYTFATQQYGCRLFLTNPHANCKDICQLLARTALSCWLVGADTYISCCSEMLYDH